MPPLAGKLQARRSSAAVDDLGYKEAALDVESRPKAHAPRQDFSRAARLAPRASAAELEALCARALDRYRVRVLDDVDLSRLDGAAARGSVIARALMERGAARAFAMAREILAFIETRRWP